MSDDVLVLHNKTTLDIPSDRVLESAIGQLESVIIAGKTNDGYYYFASSLGSDAESLFLSQMFSKDLLESCVDKE